MAQVANWLDADGPDYLAALGDEGMNRLCDTVLGAGTRAYVKNILETLKKAEIATRLAQWKEAEGYLQTLKGFGTRAMGVQMEVGRCKFEEGDHDTAVALLKDLTVRYPATSSIIYNYAYLLVNVANYPEAAKQLIKATKLNPEDGQMKFALACCYAEQGMKDEAWTILSQLQATYPNQLREWAQGDAPYLRAIQQDPRYPQLIAAPAPQPKQPSSKDSPKS
jgi:thioredoxin-like negative regulator of GroEL